LILKERRNLTDVWLGQLRSQLLKKLLPTGALDQTKFTYPDYGSAIFKGEKFEKS
jgi:hypothetical protein